MVESIAFKNEHFEEVCRVMHVCGLEFDDAIFHRHFLGNPLMEQNEAQSCLQGIVLVDDDRVVGFQGVVLRELYINTKPIFAYEMGVLGIEKKYRLYAPLLTGMLYAQKQVFAFYGNTSSLAASRMYKIARFKDGPESCARIRYSVNSWGCFLPIAISKTRWKRLSSSCLLPLFGSVIGAIYRIFKRLPPLQSKTNMKVLKRIDQDLFSDFWNHYIENNKGLVASRAPEILEWLFAKEVEKENNCILGRFDRERLVGYIVLRQTKMPNSDAKRFFVADWIAINNDKAILADLLRDGSLFCESQGGVVFEILGYPSSYQGLISRYLPFSRKIAANSFQFKTTDEFEDDFFRDQADSGWFWGAMDADRCVT